MSLPNPYEVLRLAPSATEEEIIRQAGRLRQRSTDEATLSAIRQATQALTGRAEDRLLHALLTHPNPRYTQPGLDRLGTAFRRPPPLPANTTPCPPLDLSEFTRLLEAVLVEELEFTNPPFEPLLAADDVAEIDRQASEALWQSLLYDQRS
jgi:hypothetical protein